jgi:hypothetical protein
MRRPKDGAAALVVPREESGTELLPSDLMVRRIIAMLINRAWIVGHSHYEVAKLEGVTPARAYDAYREALRFIRIARDAEANRTQILIRAREIADRDEPDRLNALTLLARMTGAIDPPKGEEMRTSEERVAYLRECLRDPDDELLEALLAEKETVMKALAIPVEGEAVEE